MSTDENNKQAVFEALFKLWQEKIPLVNAMQVRVDSTRDGQSWSLIAPLAPNSNHMGTAFGGSIATLATLAGWAHTWLLTPNPLAYDIVVAKSSIEYLLPAKTDIVASAKASTQSEIQSYIKRLERHSRASLNVEISVTSAAQCVAKFHGKFAAILKPDAG